MKSAKTHGGIVRRAFVVLGGALAIVAVWGSSLSAAPGGAVVDAKRQAAEKLIRDGKHADAVTLLTEIVGGEHSGYHDYLLLARAQEKIKNHREAVMAYRKVLELVQESTAKREERAARNEAKMKLGALDVIGPKLDVLVKDAEKRVQELLQESEKAGDWDAVARIIQFWVALRKLGGDEQVAYFEVQADRPFQKFEFQVEKGNTYRIRAYGRWRISPDLDCTADGRLGTQAPSGLGPIGSLIVCVYGGKNSWPMAQVGSNALWTSPATSPLSLGINEGILSKMDQKEDNSGKLHVFILRERGD